VSPYPDGTMKQAFVRARRPEHKQQRREAILAAARDLALESGVRNVSLGGVAAAVGLAKSNVGRYFGTREEIYLELATEEWAAWRDAAVRRLHDAPGPDHLAAALAETIGERPLLCDLLSQTSTALEHNVSVAAARTFKRTMLDIVSDLGREVVRAHGDLTEQEGFEFVGATAAFAGALYPAANPPPRLAQVYAENPELAVACLPLVPTLTRLLRALVAGLPTLR
jgi:AcrR family transcriptional regulator